MPRPDAAARIQTCLTLTSTLWMSRENVTDALMADPHGKRYPPHNPLVRLQSPGGRAVHYNTTLIDPGALPERLDLPVLWWEGDRAGDERALRRFAKHTQGKATFALVADDGTFRPYKIRGGKLIRITTPLEVGFRRPPTDPVALRRVGPPATPVLPALAVASPVPEPVVVESPTPSAAKTLPRQEASTKLSAAMLDFEEPAPVPAVEVEKEPLWVEPYLPSPPRTPAPQRPRPAAPPAPRPRLIAPPMPKLPARGAAAPRPAVPPLAPPMGQAPVAILPPLDELRRLLTRELPPAEAARVALAVALHDEEDEMSRGALIPAAMRLKPMLSREVCAVALTQLVRDGAFKETVGLFRLA